MLSSSQLHNILDYLHVRAGLVVNEAQHEYLRKSLSRLFQDKSIESYDQAISALRSHELSSNHLERLIIDTVTTGESYFFRDQNFFAYLRCHLLPQLIAKKVQQNNKTIRVWSAGCSCGQEIYSLAILLGELLQNQQEWSIDLVGTDICEERIQQAISAKYDNWSLRTVDAMTVNRYFNKVVDNGLDRYELIQDIRRRVRFKYLNLLDESYPSLVSGLVNVDILICKNVFIYLSKDRICEIMQRMHSTLESRGVLILTPSDYSSVASDGLFDATLEKGFYYLVKSGGHNERGISVSSYSYLDTDCDAPDLSNQTCSDSGLSVESSLDQLTEHDELIQKNRWEEVLRLCEANIYSQSSDLQLLHINALANLGKVEEALEKCGQMYKEYKESKELHLVWGILLSSIKNTEDASRSFAVCVFLDPNFVEAHYHRGLLFLSTGNVDQAKGCFSLAERSYMKIRGKRLKTILHPRVPLAEIHTSIQSYLQSIG